MAPAARLLPLLLSLFALLPAGPPYAGPFKDDPRLKTVLAALPAWKAAALADAARRLGVPAPPEGAVTLVLRDAAPPPAGGYRMFEGAQFRTSGKPPKIVLTLYAEFLINGRFDVPAELAHEAVHAVMRHTLATGHDRVPEWVREGLAVHLAGQGEERIDALLTAPDHAESPADAIRPLAERHGLADYARDFLFVEHLRRVGRFEAFVRELMAGRGLEQALGEPVDTFETAARAFARAEITARAGEAHEAYRAILRASRDRRWEELAQFTAEFPRDRPSTRYAAVVGYFAAKAALFAGKEAEALLSLEAWRATPEAARTWCFDDGLLLAGRALMRERRPDEAAVQFERAVREFPDSQGFDTAAYDWGFALAAAGRKERATELLQRALASFPAHKSAVRARKLLQPAVPAVPHK
ncbi:MAG: tetratricopeptide repeat protein [Planctomycetes bacterium]|nr:tetratricopeptide repeat protein [Planctomycetota bacterium]